MTSLASSVADRAKALVDSASEAADRALRSTQRSASEKLGRMASAVEEVSAETRPAISRIANDVDVLRRRGGDVMRGASVQARRAADRSVAFIHDEPVKFVLLATGIAAFLIALIGAIGRADSARE